jgi:transcription elongation factor Elf1
MSDIRFLCPSCSSKLVVDSRYAGYIVDCPRCGKKIRAWDACMLDIRFLCPGCEAKLAVDASAAGYYLDCPRCGRKDVQVPHPPAERAGAAVSAAEAGQTPQEKPAESKQPEAGGAGDKVSGPESTPDRAAVAKGPDGKDAGAGGAEEESPAGPLRPGSAPVLTQAEVAFLSGKGKGGPSKAPGGAAKPVPRPELKPRKSIRLSPSGQ